MNSPNRAQQDKNLRGSEPPSRRVEPRFLTVGRVLRPHGVNGELRILMLTDFPERLCQHKLFYLGTEARPFPVKAIRFHQEAALVKLEGCDDRDTAETFRGQWVQIPLETAVPLEENEVYHFQLVGIEVITDQEESLGRVTEVLETGANDVLVIRGLHGEVLLPITEEVVQELDLKAQRMTVTIPPGLLDE